MARITRTIIMLLGLIAAPAYANYVVNSNGDAPRSANAAAGECDTGSVVPAPGAGFEPECTLRAAIETANLVDSGSLATISFADHIPTDGDHTGFNPATALPDIETPIRIDGTTHPNYDSANGIPRVILDGNSLTENAHGLRVTANGSSSQIISLNIIRFSSGAGIQITNADNVLVTQTQIGQFVSTNVPAPNNWGIRINNGSDNIIGDSSSVGPPIGPWPNVISGNTTNGVQISGDNNSLGRNHIGISPIGDQPTPNGGAGVSIVSGQGNQIGNAQGRSIIAANSGGQVLIQQSASQATLQCSRIGTNAAGDGILGSSTEPAIEVLGNGHTIGTQACPNIIAGHVALGRSGEFPVTSSFNTVEHNGVGTNFDGDDLGTNALGIFVYDGEGNEIRHNTIGNALIGIGMGGSTVNNHVQSNFVGVDANGNAMPIAGDAIFDAGSGNGNNIGGSIGQGNVVGNANVGIRLTSTSTNSIVRDNLIGATPAGVAAPVDHGINVNGSSHQVGGAGAGNRIGNAEVTGIRLLSGASGVNVADNRIGTEPTLTGFAASAIGIRVSGSDHVIGGFNYIGSVDVGIRVFEGTHQIVDNRIGIDADLNAWPISTHGIRLGNSSSDIFVTGNWIGHSTRGIRINSTSSGAVIGNNWIGVTPDLNDIGNSSYGLYSTGVATVIGTDPVTSQSMPNVVGFNGEGMRLGGSNALVINNYIGRDPGNDPIPNQGSGVIVLNNPDNVSIGLSSSANANLINNNAGHGIEVRSAGDDVVIGVNSIIGNQQDGIHIDQGVFDVTMQSSVDLTLGALTLGGNQGHAIGFHPQAGTGNRIRRVNMTNVGKEIDLGPGGRDQDPGDADTGPNNLQNFPEFDQTVSGFDAAAGDVFLRFRVDSAPGNSAYPISVDVYRAEATGHAVTRGFVGGVQYVQADAQEFVEVSLTPVAGSPNLDADSWFVATATDALGNTSELSEPFGGPPRYSVGGVISNLTGSGLVLQNNGGDDLQITQTGTFSFQFDTDLPDGSSYSVSVSAQPSGQTCAVANGTGTISGADINDVQVDCQVAGDVIFQDRFEVPEGQM